MAVFATSVQRMYRSVVLERFPYVINCLGLFVKEKDQTFTFKHEDSQVQAEIDRSIIKILV